MSHFTGISDAYKNGIRVTFVEQLFFVGLNHSYLYLLAYCCLFMGSRRYAVLG